MAASADLDLARRIAVACYGAEARAEPIPLSQAFRLWLPQGLKVLKLGPPGATSIRKELRLVEVLVRHGVPVPVVEHADADGTRVGRPFFIMDSAGDSTVAHLVGRADEDTRRLFVEMGSILAAVHGITVGTSGDIPPDAIEPRDWPARIRRLHGLADWIGAERLLEPDELAKVQAIAIPETGGDALCHGDFHAVQCIVRGGRIAAVVDWEQAWAGNPGIDLAIAHAYLDYYASPEQVRRFLEGYTSSRPLPDDYEGAYLPVRMGHVLGVLRVARTRGREANVKRAVELYRAYCAAATR